jgi:hypothetical protein
MQLTPDLSKAVYGKAVEFGAFTAFENPESVADSEYQKAASMLIEAVTTAASNGNVAPAVLEILHVAQIEPASDSTREAYKQRFGSLPTAPAETNGHSEAPVEPSAFTQTSPPSAPSEAQGPECREQASPGPVGSEPDQLSDNDEPAREAAQGRRYQEGSALLVR